MRPLLITSLIIFLLFLTSTLSYSKNFWDIYALTLIENHYKQSHRSMSYREQPISSNNTLSIVAKSFSQSFGQRLYNRPNYLASIPCMFNREPEKCLLEAQTNPMFDEIHFINSPEISQHSINRIKSLSSSLFVTRNKSISKQKRAFRTPHSRILRPKLGFDSNNLDVFITSPFYTYSNIYIEPQYALRSGFSLTAIKDNWILEIQDSQASLHYGFDENINFVITEHCVYFESVILFK